jgi:hypothetical protein
MALRFFEPFEVIEAENLTLVVDQQSGARLRTDLMGFLMPSERFFGRAFLTPG